MRDNLLQMLRYKKKKKKKEKVFVVLTYKKIHLQYRDFNENCS